MPARPRMSLVKRCQLAPEGGPEITRPVWPQRPDQTRCQIEAEDFKPVLNAGPRWSWGGAHNSGAMKIPNLGRGTSGHATKMLTRLLFPVAQASVKMPHGHHRCRRGISHHRQPPADASQAGKIRPVMSPVITLAFPFFGLIILGFGCGKLMKIPEDGLRWMNFFIVYIALPPLFFKLIGATPFEQLTNWRFILTTTLCTYIAFVLSFGMGIIASRGNIREATIQGIFGSYSNVGYMGPGLTLAALGPQSAVPTALIFVFDSILLFALLPFLMALGGTEKIRFWATARLVIVRIASHPFNIATAVGVAAAYFKWQPPQALDTMLLLLKNAAAPVALFALGVTVALRPLTKIPVEMPAHLMVKLVLHPFLVFTLLSLIGDFDRVWVLTATLMAALPPALNVFVMARQYETYVDRASSGVLVGTLVSILTVTGLLWLIAENRLPVW